ncbi:MAG: hypothetical protein NTY39_03570 [Campylobacterales bacterium]|jgi:hypothetical protein|nr:hypothetical protein [Campylobacterales bacterium]
MVIFEKVMYFFTGENCKGKYLQLPLKPSNIPATPWNVYKDKGYIGITDWLGINN